MGEINVLIDNINKLLISGIISHSHLTPECLRIIQRKCDEVTQTVEFHTHLLSIETEGEAVDDQQIEAGAISVEHSELVIITLSYSNSRQIR